MAKKRKSGTGRKKSRKKSSKSLSFFRLFVIFTCLAVAGIFIYERLAHKGADLPQRSERSARARKDITLYIANGEKLKGVRRSIKNRSLKSEIKETFRILLWADSGNLIPRGTELRSVRIEKETAHLDISSAIRDNHPGGTSAEMQTIYSIVNSITLNFSAIKQVKILIDGKSEKTLAGHIDISGPLGPYRGLIQDS